MINAKNNKIFVGFTILFLCLLYVSVNAQTTIKVVDELVIKLQNKVLLTEKQAGDIKSSLNNYFDDPSEEKLSSLQSKVESVLNGKQKIKYNIIKDDWMKNVQQELSKVKRK